MAHPPGNILYGDVPYQQRWEFLRPIITQLYVEQDMSASEVASTMNADHGFVAREDQYKYQFRKWKIKKNLNKSLKRKMMDKGDERAGDGKRTAFSLGDKPVDNKRLLREVKRESKIDMALTPSANGQTDMQRMLPGFGLQAGPGIFLAWNRPYGAMSLVNDPTSPFGQAISTPGDVVVATPESNNAPSPMDAPSPFSKALTIKRSLERTRMFVDGRFDDLLKSMNKKEAVIISSWLHEFWFYAFKTAKHWGTGPRYWNADLLGFENSLHQSPDSNQHDLSISDSPGPSRRISEAPVVEPSQLCRWSIHYSCSIKYEEIPEQDTAPHSILDENSNNWSPWPASWQEPPFQERLISGLESNDFSQINPDTLPVAAPQIARAAAQTPDVLLRESLGFAILGRNFELTEKICDQIRDHKMDLGDLNPLHMAINFLDGARSCCNIFAYLVTDSFGLRTVRDRRRLYINVMDHTLLDSLMIAILKSHTSTAPGIVDERFVGHNHFRGQEVDICGRWDADSPSFRSLSQRERDIPMTWKHKFCHTSSQAICHFVTAFNLATFGCEDEDLFGILACLLTALHCELDPIAKSDLSPELLFGEPSDSAGCGHQMLTPAELADRVPRKYITSWSPETRTGWELFRLTLWKATSARLAKARVDDEDMESSDEYENSCNAHGRQIAFNGQCQVNNLFAAVQAELVTYRRIQETDPWISENIDLHNLVQDLREGDNPQLSIGTFQKNILKPICSCGTFNNFPIVKAEDTCTHYISNMDIWSRTTFIPFPETGY
ncbi:hypothetical protein MW887_005039 [Aspergillus wentii]|nr:hypothetical protein MW887_005039 [Aspergillus wentii]